MSNIFRLMANDCKRLFSNVMCTIITIGLVVMPSIFAWYNVIACWNVFDNTGNLTVAVANVDEGYQSDLVPLRVNVGEQVVSALRANDEIDWTFTSEEDAIDGAKAGRYYAAVVIPESFSRDMLTFYSDDVQHAQIIYYANEKKSAIAPKITDKGADSVSYQVNEVFAKTLSEISLSLAEAVTRYAQDSDLDGRVGVLAEHLEGVAGQMERAASVLTLYSSLATATQSLVQGSADLIDSAQHELNGVADIAVQGSSSATTMADALTHSADDLASAINASEQAFAAVSESTDRLFDAASNETLACAAQLRTQASHVGAQAEQYRAVAQQLNQLHGVLPPEYDQPLDLAVTRCNAVADLLVNMQGVLNDAASAVESGDASAQDKREEVAALAQTAQDKIGQLEDEFSTTLKPGMQQIIDNALALSQSASAGMDKLNAAGTDLSQSVRSVGSLLGDTSQSISEATGNLTSSALELRTLAANIDQAITEQDIEQLREIIGSDVQTLSRALAAPVGLERVAVFPSETFGSAMAPFYTTLALFIGSLLILVVVKPTVSERARKELCNPKPYQLFLGRFGAMAFISLLQTTLMGLGNMLFLQVQVAHPFLFMLCFWTAGLVFTFIIYALVASFANLGKAVAVLMLIVQVTGCGGSFPLQILPSFIQALSPWLPATHVVNAMRAAMFGTYGNDFWIELGTLALFLIPAALLGLVLRKPLAKFMNWYIEQVEASKLVG